MNLTIDIGAPPARGNLIPELGRLLERGYQERAIDLGNEEAVQASFEIVLSEAADRLDLTVTSWAPIRLVQKGYA